VCARHVYGVTFIKYTQYRNIGKLNNFKVFLSNTGKTIKLSKIVFIDKMEEKKYHTVGTVPESITLIHIYISPHFLGLVQALQFKM
jgi:hypothetical protein